MVCYNTLCPHLKAQHPLLFVCLSLSLPAGQVLTFKELTWQTLRIEADATENGDQDPITTPLKLITNQGRIQISLKRKASVFFAAGCEMLEFSHETY